MKCADFKKQIDAHIDGILDAKNEREMRAHADECRACKAELSDAKKIRRALSQLPELKAPRGFEARVAARIATPQKSRVAKIFLYPLAIKIPLQVAALFVVGLLILFNRDYYSIHESAETKSYAIAEAVAEKENSLPAIEAKKTKGAPAAARGAKLDSALAESNASSKSAPAMAMRDEMMSDLKAKKAEAEAPRDLTPDPLYAVEIIIAARAHANEEDSVSRASKIEGAAGMSAYDFSEKQDKEMAKKAPAAQAKTVERKKSSNSADIEKTAKGAGATVTSVSDSRVNVQISQSQLTQLKKDLSTLGTVNQKAGKDKDHIIIEITP